MFESLSPSKRKVIEKLNIEEKPNITCREKISKLLMNRYMKTHNFFKPNLRIAEEIQKFVNQTRNTEKELKEFDKKIEKIVREIKSDSPNSNSKEIMIKNSNINQTFRENEELTQGKFSLDLNPQNQKIKLPLVQTKSETTNSSSVKPESRTSKRSKMSGGSYLSNYNDGDAHAYKLKSMFKNMSIDNEIFKNKQQNLPYDINDYDSIIKYDTLLFKEEMKRKKEAKLNFQRLMRKELNDQIEEREAKIIEEKRRNLEFDEFINNHNEILEQAEKEKKINAKNKYKEDLDIILKFETLKKIENFNRDRKVDREYVKRFVSQLNQEKQIKLNKKKIDREFFEDLKKIEEQKKENDMKRILQDKENDIKLMEETNMILDKQHKMRLQKLYSQNNENQVKPSVMIQKGIDNESTKNDNDNLINKVSFEAVNVKNEETVLKQILYENLKKYNLLEEKIKEIDQKLENTRHNHKNTNYNSVSLIPYRKDRHTIQGESEFKNSAKDELRIIRPSNSFVGMKLDNSTTNGSRSIKRSIHKLKPLSEVKGKVDKSMITNKLNTKNKLIEPKNTSMLFTTQLI